MVLVGIDEVLASRNLLERSHGQEEAMHLRIWSQWMSITSFVTSNHLIRSYVRVITKQRMCFATVFESRPPRL